jgi:hypothetical protein
MAIVKASNRANVVKAINNGDLWELGPGGTPHSVAVLEIQFAPSVDFVGSFSVMGKILGVAGDTAPFLPIPYRRVNINAAVSDYAMVGDPVIPAAIIHVPSNGLTIALLVTCTSGFCQIYSMDLNGSSAV